jgi:hypothetical protein
MSSSSKVDLRPIARAIDESLAPPAASTGARALFNERAIRGAERAVAGDAQDIRPVLAPDVRDYAHAANCRIRHIR